ncbi:chloride channel protein [Brenneria uluponensis]|uniref:chloride channel protein n=1 Tax=Brenneria uluponensis TaxID=3057057 RepID=UPI0028F156B2|nr:chloride channel protein [Brenneria ulupoensis]
MSYSPPFNWRFITGLVLTGIVAGIGGILLTLLLHAVQHLAYGYSLNHILGQQHFLDGVTAAVPSRRFLAMMMCGVVAGAGWMLLYRYGRRLVSISAALQNCAVSMPIRETLIHIVLQIVTVGLGSPLGRETAPRELGSLFASHLSQRWSLLPEQARVLIACGAGSGLAAVYNVPLAGAVFSMEVLLKKTGLKLTFCALLTSVLATLTARYVLGDNYQYPLNATFHISSSLVIWALLVGPIFGAAAWLFSRMMHSAKQSIPQNKRLLIFNLINFTLMGVLVLWLPELLGNGKGIAEMSFTSQLSISLALLLLICKTGVVWGSLKAGSRGGLLTPSLSCGALLGYITGAVWNLWFPEYAPGAFALVGATAFLGAAMNMPFTSIVLIVEFTHVEPDFLIPLIVATAGATLTGRYLHKQDKVTLVRTGEKQTP